MVAVAPQVHEVGQRMLGEAQPALLDIRGQLFRGFAGQYLGVAVSAAAAEHEQEVAAHGSPWSA
ncbi:hypothetical protein GCM10011579_078070 [Streptomyces albiflavescens]|uniref:Uncharacterized protein n=1 Tax=Streptomyces albiflavescens TaxID=1623582 RepID=A0A917YCP3_9ACTN|nr:hypothetical protein GCM10011579_078070 [Streptomyces albiflavescens]